MGMPDISSQKGGDVQVTAMPEGRVTWLALVQARD
jgi:hypothetical protein